MREFTVGDGNRAYVGERRGRIGTNVEGEPSSVWVPTAPGHGAPLRRAPVDFNWRAATHPCQQINQEFRKCSTSCSFYVHVKRGL